MLLRWFPWKWLVRHASRRYQVLDPLTVLARVRSFAEPSEAPEPLEIVRAWMIFHARGMVNTRAIQHNLDWTWPYWVVRQFDPRDPAFVPRSYSLTHVNLTHRNWTAVGLADLPVFPLVDPRGMVTPMYDGWSLDFQVACRDGERLAPSAAERCEQQWGVEDDELAIRTRITSADAQRGLEHVVTMRWDDQPLLVVRLSGWCSTAGDLVVSLRPYNAEGVQFIDRIETEQAGRVWCVNRRDHVRLSRRPRRQVMSTYDRDDALNLLDHGPARDAVRCRVGMATAAAMFPLDPGEIGGVELTIPLGEEVRRLRHDGVVGAAQRKSADTPCRIPWTALERQTALLQLPDPKWQWLYEQSARTLLLLSPQAIYPGPYVYRRFWYRDACLMLHALLAIGHGERCRRVIEEVFPQRQRRDGFFESQEGEWDSNGQVLWIAAKVAAATGRSWSSDVLEAMARGVRWLAKKRLPEDGRPHGGLLPAGFSAEHLGPNNYYYWDNFWALAGLRAAAGMFDAAGRPDAAREAAELADAFDRSIEQSLGGLSPLPRAPGAMPAAPGRRMDAGAIGSLVADYPLHLEPLGSRRVLATAEFLLQHCLVHGAFFQDMTHSGLNPYLTLHLAQVLLRAGDPRHGALIDVVAGLATDTGVWPEAVHPATGGGVIGDGQHGWAAAEWCLAMRALLLREEHDQLVIGPGVQPAWLDAPDPIRIGETPTRFGPVSVTLSGTNGEQEAIVEGDWHASAPSLRLAIPGCEPADLQPGRPHRLRRLSDAHRDVHQHLRAAGRRD